MNVAILNGLKITTDKKFIKFTKSNSNSITTNAIADTFIIEFTEGASANEFCSKNVEVVSPCVILQETDYIRVYNTLVQINGLVLRSLVPYEYQFNQFIVDDINDFYISFDETHCSILIPKRKEKKFKQYLKVLRKNPYLEIVNDSNITSLNNIYGFEFNRQNVCIDSTNTFVFNNKAYYTRYLISDIDYVSSFIKQLESILEGYGMTLHRYPIDETTRTVDRVIYKVTEYAKQDSHRSGYIILTDELLHHTTLEFEASFLNKTIYDDFITRYQNLDLISNFSQFDTLDSRGRAWKASAKWDPVSTDYNPDYSQDGQGNSGYTCNFRVEIQYWVVYDKIFKQITSIISNILGTAYPNDNKEVNIENPPIDNKPPYDELTDVELTTVVGDEIDEWLKLR